MAGIPNSSLYVKNGMRTDTGIKISEEVARARKKFPGTKRLTVALGEEYGELCAAQLQRKPRDEIVKEAIQVAAMAVRVIEEGDSDFDDVTDAEALP